MTLPRATRAQMTQPDADRIAGAVLACPLVAGLHGGRFGEVATYLPGRRIPGIRVTPTEVLVHVTGQYPATVRQIAHAVRACAGPHTADLSVTVIVEDLDLPAVAPSPTPSTPVKEPSP